MWNNIEAAELARQIAKYSDFNEDEVMFFIHMEYEEMLKLAVQWGSRNTRNVRKQSAEKAIGNIRHWLKKPRIKISLELMARHRRPWVFFNCVKLKRGYKP